MKLRFEDMVNRSTVTLASLVLLLGILLAARAMAPQSAQTVSQIIESEQTETIAQETTGDFFKDFRAQRKQARADEIDLLNEIIDRENAPQESVVAADQRKIELTRATEQERMMEKMLIAKGFEDAAAFVMEESVTIAVKKAELSQEDSAKILELALRCTGLDAQNIKIIPVAPE